MAETRVAGGLSVAQWDDDYFLEYTQENVFRPYWGTGINDIIQVNEQLGRKKGDRFTFGLVNQLTNEPVLGNQTLEGNEEDLSTRSMPIVVDLRRNGVKIPKMEEQRSAIDLRNAAKDALKTWSSTDLRNGIITALYSLDGVNFPQTTAAQRNTWVTNNQDRVMFGKVNSNYSTTFATAMATLDNTDDRATAALISLIKRKALQAVPKIRPVDVDDGKRVYVAFCHPLVFRDLAQSLQTVNREAWLRGMSNPVFTGADLFYEGVVIKELDDAPLVAANTGYGNTVQASPIFFTGAQAVGLAYAQRSRTIEEEFDYKSKAGIAVEEIRGIAKFRFGTGIGDTDTPKDAGMVTAWVAAPADA